MVTVRISDAAWLQSLRDVLTLSTTQIYSHSDTEVYVAMPGFPEESERRIVTLLVDAWRRERNVDVHACITIVADEEKDTA